LGAEINYPAECLDSVIVKLWWVSLNKYGDEAFKPVYHISVANTDPVLFSLPRHGVLPLLIQFTELKVGSGSVGSLGIVMATVSAGPDG